MLATSNSSTPAGSLSRSTSFNQSSPFVGSPPHVVHTLGGTPQHPGLMSQAALVTLAPAPAQPLHPHQHQQHFGPGQMLHQLPMQPGVLGNSVGQNPMIAPIGVPTPPGTNTPPGVGTPAQQHLQQLPFPQNTSPVLSGQPYMQQPFVQVPGQPPVFQQPMPVQPGPSMPVFNILNSPPVAALPKPVRPTVAATNAGPTAKANTAQRVHVPAVKPKVDPADVGPRQLIINHLSRQVTEAELFHVFDQVGPVQCAKLILDKDTQRTRGYGFVYFASSTDATNAIKALNGTMLLGKEIQVGFANPQRPLYDTVEASTEILNKEIANLRKAGLPTQ